MMNLSREMKTIENLINEEQLQLAIENMVDVIYELPDDNNEIEVELQNCFNEYISQGCTIKDQLRQFKEKLEIEEVGDITEVDNLEDNIYYYRIDYLHDNIMVVRDIQKEALIDIFQDFYNIIFDYTVRKIDEDLVEEDIKNNMPILLDENMKNTELYNKFCEKFEDKYEIDFNKYFDYLE